MKHFNHVILFICSLIIGIAYAAPTPNVASGIQTKANASAATNGVTLLQIRAQNIQAEKNNTTKYSGNVQISKGTLVITAETAIMRNKQGVVMLSGNPATFIDMVSVKEQVTANAKTMNFDSKANKIILKGNVSITKNGKTEKDKQRIFYDLNTHDYKF